MEKQEDKTPLTQPSVPPRPLERKRGFACLSVEKRREIARKGGQAAHALGVAHEFTAEEAREAGRKGGRAISKDRLYMAAIGRKGGKQSGRRYAAREAAHSAPRESTR
jgi:general stress protein YciG